MASVEWLPTNDLRRIHNPSSTLGPNTVDPQNKLHATAAPFASTLFTPRTAVLGQPVKGKNSGEWMSEFYVKFGVEST